MGFRSKDNIKVELTVRRTPFSFDSTSFGVKKGYLGRKGRTTIRSKLARHSITSSTFFAELKFDLIRFELFRTETLQAETNG